MRVEALQVCFVGNVKRQIGDVYDVPKGTALKTKNMPPVMKRVPASTPLRQVPPEKVDEPLPPDDFVEEEEEDEETSEEDS